MAESRTCAECESPYVATRSDALYCSRACGTRVQNRNRSNAYPVIPGREVRVCELPECTVVFTPPRPSSRFCSRRHYQIDHVRRASAEGRKVNPPWTDARRNSYHKRKALKKGSATGNPVLLSEIAKRDNFRCGICRRNVCMNVEWPDPLSPSIDHVVPLSRGGSHSPDNCQLAHLFCNTSKSNRLTA